MPSKLASFPAGSTVLVQGASRGIGLGLARALLEDPAMFRVIATCRDPGNAEQLKMPVCDRLSIQPLDITVPAAIDALATELKQDRTRLSLVINAAGILHGEDFGPEKKLEDLDAAALNQIIRTASIEFGRRNRNAIVTALHPNGVHSSIAGSVSFDKPNPPAELRGHRPHPPLFDTRGGQPRTRVSARHSIGMVTAPAACSRW